MSDNMIPLMLQAGIAARQAEESRAFTREMDALGAARNIQNSIAVSMLNALVTGIQGARTAKEARQSFQLFGKQFEKMTKDMPGGPYTLFNENDLVNIERLIQNRNMASSELTKVVAQQVGNLITGKEGVTFDTAIDALQTKITDLTQKYGEEDVAMMSGAAYSAITDAAVRAQTFRETRNSARMALATSMNSFATTALRFVPSAAEMVKDFEANADVIAQAHFLAKELGTPQPSIGEINAAKQLEGARALGLADNSQQIAKLNEQQLGLAWQEGDAIWTRKLNEYRSALSHKFFTRDLPLVLELGNEQYEMLVGTQHSNMRRVLGTDLVGPDVLQLSSLDQDEIVKTLREVDAKVDAGIPTERDHEVVRDAIDAARASGLLNEGGIDFMSMTEEQFQNSIQNGVVEGAMRQIKGPGGMSLYDLVFDGDGQVLPYADRIVEIDHEKLRRGDAVAWDYAKFVSTFTDPGEFKTTSPDGKEWGLFQAHYYSTESDPMAYRRRVEALGARYPGYADYVAGTNPRDEAASTLYSARPGGMPVGAIMSMPVPGNEELQRVAPGTTIGTGEVPVIGDVLARIDETMASGDDAAVNGIMANFNQSITPNQGSLKGLFDDVVSRASARFRSAQTIDERVGAVVASTSNALLNEFPEDMEEAESAVANRAKEASSKIGQMSGQGFSLSEAVQRRAAGSYEIPTMPKPLELPPLPGPRSPVGIIGGGRSGMDGPPKPHTYPNTPWHRFRRINLGWPEG